MISLDETYRALLDGRIDVALVTAANHELIGVGIAVADLEFTLEWSR
jgi:hypothetical protein